MRRTLCGLLGVASTTLLLGVLSSPAVSASDCGFPGCDPGHMSATAYPKAYPPNGSPGTIYIAFSSSVSYDWWWNQWATFSGSSDDGWWGCCPWNPTNNRLTDAWWASGIAVSASIPAGVGFSGQGAGSASYTTDVGGYWRAHHNFSGIQFNAMDLFNVSENVCEDMQFSYDGEYHCTTNHSILV